MASQHFLIPHVPDAFSPYNRLKEVVAVAIMALPDPVVLSEWKNLVIAKF